MFPVPDAVGDVNEGIPNNWSATRERRSNPLDTAQYVCAVHTHTKTSTHYASLCDAPWRTQRIDSHGRLRRFVSQAGLLRPVPNKVASFAALDSPPLPMTKKCVQFNNRRGLSNAGLSKSVLSCSTFHTARTIKNTENHLGLGALCKTTLCFC